MSVRKAADDAARQQRPLEDFAGTFTGWAEPEQYLTANGTVRLPSLEELKKPPVFAGGFLGCGTVGWLYLIRTLSSLTVPCFTRKTPLMVLVAMLPV